MLDSWTRIVIGVGILGIGLAVIFIVGNMKRNANQQEAKDKIKAVVRRETGWPITKIVMPFPDGWVRVGRGDYMLPRIREGQGDDEEFLSAEDAQIKRIKSQTDGGVAIKSAIKPMALEWDVYPSKPWLGMSWTQVPIRKQDWWENDFHPIVREERKTEYTAIDAQAHTREMDAMNVGIKIQESEARQKQFMEALQGGVPKMHFYIIMGIVIVLLVVGIAIAKGG